MEDKANSGETHHFVFMSFFIQGLWCQRMIASIEGLGQNYTHEATCLECDRLNEYFEVS